MDRKGHAGPRAIGWRERLAGAGAPLLLDGALGTELERRGAPSTLPLWSTHALLAHPDLVRTIHREYVEAGAEILTACTFRTQRRTLLRAGRGDEAAALTARAIALAREALAETRPTSGGETAPVWIAGSAPGLEDCYRPDLVPPEDELVREHREHAEHLARGGADLVLCETHNTVREAVAAVRAATEAGLPAIASLVCGPGARLLSGEPLAAALDALAPLAPAAVAVNCLPVAQVASCLPVLAAGGLPFGVYANLGAPAEPGGTGWSAEVEAGEYAEAALGWLAAGARFVGGCCGTRPAHVAALAARRAAAEHGRGGGR